MVQFCNGVLLDNSSIQYGSFKAVGGGVRSQNYRLGLMDRDFSTVFFWKNSNYFSRYRKKVLQK